MINLEIEAYCEACGNPILCRLDSVDKGTEKINIKVNRCDCCDESLEQKGYERGYGDYEP